MRRRPRRLRRRTPLPHRVRPTTSWRRPEGLWDDKASKFKAAKAAHKQAEADGDKRATLIAFNNVQRTKAAEKSARAKLDRLRSQRLGS